MTSPGPIEKTRRAQVALVVGLAVVGVALALPVPEVAGPPTTSGTPAASGPPRLEQVWPAAAVITMPSALRDGTTFQPLLPIDPATVVGVATSPDMATSKLVIRAADGNARALRTLAGRGATTVAAVTVSDGALFWLELGDDTDGQRETTLWRAALTGGTPEELATDTDGLLFYDSAHDLQIVDGTAVWAAVNPDGTGEIRSVPLTGGAITVRRLDRLYALTTWPWVTSSAGSRPGDVEQLNLETGERRTVPAGPSEILTCTPVWCRVTTLVNQGQSLLFEAERVDGTLRQKTGTGAQTPVNTDVALLDRFEVLAATAASNDSGYNQKLLLHDLTGGRTVLLADGVTATIGSRGPYVWWSTGDNETVTWHLLDLRTLK